MDNEVWKEVPGSEGFYRVSNMGRIWRLERVVYRSNGRKHTVKEMIYNGYMMSNGYRGTTINYNGKRLFTGEVHRLVAMIFLSHIPDGMNYVVDHKNNIKTDNRLCNLQIITNRHNTSRSRKNGTSIYTGVHFDSKRSKWVSQIQVNGKRKRLGEFKDELEAYKAYQHELDKIKKPLSSFVNKYKKY